MTFAEFAQNCQSFNSAVVARNNSAAASYLPALKTGLLELDSLPPLCVNSENCQAERSTARDFLEHAVLYAVNAGDKESFHIFSVTLRPYYTMFRTILPESPHMFTVLGLNLLYLLVENRLAEFHCELELLDEAQRSRPEIEFCRKLDQHLMVGSYDQVMSAASHPPVSYYGFFLKSLLETVRVNIAECAAASYASLSIAAATRMMMFNNESETIAFVTEQYPQWEIRSSSLFMQAPTKAPKSAGIPSLRLITQTLSYATELERIV